MSPPGESRVAQKTLAVYRTRNALACNPFEGSVMKSRCSILLATCLLIAADDKELARQELKGLEGTWTMAALEVEGNKVAEDKIQGAELVIKDGKYIVTT